MYTAPKYGNRILREHELQRFLELKKGWEKVMGEPYKGYVVNSKNNETLMDAACSVKRYNALNKYYFEKYQEKQQEKQRQIKKQESISKNTTPSNKTTEDLIEEVNLDLHCQVENFIKDLVDKQDESFKEFIEILTQCVEVSEEEDEKEVNEDMNKAEKIYQEAFELMKSRNKKYGDSWKVLSIQSLANLCEMKLHRIANLNKLEPKIYDELIDTLNYMVFGLLKLKEQDGGNK